MSDLSVGKTRNGYWAVYRKDVGRISRTYFSRSEAVQARARFGERGAAQRKCLTCGAAFDSEGVHERLCHQHRRGSSRAMAANWSPNKGRVHA